MNIFKTYFEFNDLLFLGIGILFVFVAIFYQEIKNNEKISLLFLLIGALIIRIFIAGLDPFFNVWDEQYHALVAKNMLKNPFKPTLYLNPALPFNVNDWGSNHIWLHKQPLFLWQIALSFKLFGISPFSLRIPSIILSTIVVFFTYDIGKQFFNKQIAFYAALLMCGQNYILQLVSGYNGCDHNDIAFLFYVTASIWAWIKYINSNSYKWILFIGIFSGMAVLNKWLTGLLVYFGWFWYIIQTKQLKEKTQIFRFLTSIFVSIIVFLPWQIYILMKYPAESLWEFKYNSLHFTEVIEGHGGSFWYHFQIFGDIYGYLYIFIVPFGLLLLLYKNNFKNNSGIISLILNIFIVYLFFSIAKTKMFAFTTIVTPYILIIIAFTFYKLFQIIELKFNFKNNILKIIRFGIVFFLFLQMLNIEKIQYYHTDWINREKNIRLQKQIQFCINSKLDNLLSDREYIIFNLPEFSHITTMILSKHTAYDYLPDIDQINYLKNKNKRIAILNYNSIPDYLLNDSTLTIIKSNNWDDIKEINLKINH